jgi:hypothetical protein
MSNPMGAPTVDDPYAEAERIAREHRLRIVPVPDPAGTYEDGRRRYRTAYVVYRILPYGGSTRLGKRSDSVRLLAFVRRLAGVPA